MIDSSQEENPIEKSETTEQELNESYAANKSVGLDEITDEGQTLEDPP